MSNAPNAERYSHISKIEIVKLFDEGLSHRQIATRLNMGACAVGTRLRAEGKVRPTAAVTGVQLKECRLDPGWEARHSIANRVVCRECGELKAQLDAQGMHGHLRKHHMTVDDYRGKYPGARLNNFVRCFDQAQRQGRQTTLQQLMDEFAAKFLTATQLTECREDPEWEECQGITDYVACRRCGLKSKTDLFGHLKRHGLTAAAYREQFPKAQQVPLAMKRGYKRDYARRRGACQRDLAAKGKKLAELKEMAEQWRTIVPILWAHPDWRNDQVLRAAEMIAVSKRTLGRMRDFAGVPGPKGRPAETM